MLSDQLLLFFAILASFLCTISACYDDDLHVIKSGAFQPLVLDGTDTSQSKLQYFTNSSAQLWKFQRAKSVGYFYIVNSKTGKALDVHPAQNDIALVQRKKRSTKRQQWNLKADGRITNREINRNFHVNNNRFMSGSIVFLRLNNRDQAQEFVVERLEDVDFEGLNSRF